MYTPRSFREDDPVVLHDIIRRFNFATLFSEGDEGPMATHLPFLLEEEEDGGLALVSHMARANPHWRAFRPGGRVLVVFAGAHSYVSPTWYAETVTVPTWNYAAVHAYGVPQLMDDPQAVRAHVEALVRFHEGTGPEAWDIAAAEEKMDALLQAIVAFRIPIERLEGKMKFNQNRSREDQEGVVKALEGSADPLARETAEIMRRNLGK